MDGKLEKGTRMKTLLNNELIVDHWLAEGGQGNVYIVRYNGEEKALKWYKPTGMGKSPVAFYDNLKRNVMSRAPSSEFLWPLDITEKRDGTFGYIMDLRPEGYYEVSDFMLTHVRFASFCTVIDAALHIVSAYRLLHNKGYCYQDLNDGNFFINPQNGRVLICDNDNVAPNRMETGIIGKPRYMAPEIVTHLKMPDNLSDRFSMSVILFILFCLNHPLEGKRSLVASLTPELQERLYGTEALFIMDQENRDNEPDPVIHKNAITVWSCLPDYMKELFSRAFSQQALKNPNARPTEGDWINGLVRFRSEIVQCQCGNEVFSQQGKYCTCEKCRSIIRIPYRLKFGNYSIPGMPGSRIYKCQMGPCNAEEALQPIGRISARKTAPASLGLKNLSEKIWNATTPSGKAKRVMPGEVMPLKDGISFSVNNEMVQIIENQD